MVIHSGDGVLVMSRSAGDIAVVVMSNGDVGLAVMVYWWCWFNPSIPFTRKNIIGLIMIYCPQDSKLHTPTWYLHRIWHQVQQSYRLSLIVVDSASATRRARYAVTSGTPLTGDVICRIFKQWPLCFMIPHRRCTWRPTWHCRHSRRSRHRGHQNATNKGSSLK